MSVEEQEPYLALIEKYLYFNNNEKISKQGMLPKDHPKTQKHKEQIYLLI